MKTAMPPISHGRHGRWSKLTAGRYVITRELTRNDMMAAVLCQATDHQKHTQVGTYLEVVSLPLLHAAFVNINKQYHEISPLLRLACDYTLGMSVRSKPPRPCQVCASTLPLPPLIYIHIHVVLARNVHRTHIPVSLGVDELNTRKSNDIERST